jgi:hypothetical protein
MIGPTDLFHPSPAALFSTRVEIPGWGEEDSGWTFVSP